MLRKNKGTISSHNNIAVAELLRHKGYQAETHANIGENIYNKDMSVGVLVKGLPGYKDGLAIECRNQEAHGTTDEKLPFFILNIIHKYPFPAVLLLNGDGWSLGAIEWAEAQIDKKLIKVFTSLTDFKTWLLQITDLE